MNTRMTRTGGHLDPLKITTEEFRQILVNQFAAYPGHYYFTGFINTLTNTLVQNRIGFDPSDNSTYESVSLGFYDQATVREIVWDMIIDRYLTIGGSGHHDWPNFSVTERGKAYFNANKARS